MPTSGAPRAGHHPGDRAPHPRPRQAPGGRVVARQEHPRVPQGVLGRPGSGQGRRRHVAAARAPPHRRAAPAAPVAATGRRASPPPVADAARPHPSTPTPDRSGCRRRRRRLVDRRRASRAPSTRPWPTPTPCSSRVSPVVRRRPIRNRAAAGRRARRRDGDVARRPPRRAAEPPVPVDPRGRASRRSSASTSRPTSASFLSDAARRRPASRSSGSATRSSSRSRSRSWSGSSSPCRSCSTSCWAFIAPGPDPERAQDGPAVDPAGAAVLRARAWSSPTSSCRIAIAFLFSFTDDRPASPTACRPAAAGPYFDFVTTLFLVFGLVMEFPILLVGLSRVGIVTSERLTLLAPDGHPRHRGLRRGRDARR